ncbi:MAG: hypothetical protein IKB16_00705 [Lentisphaeria bacterium]|nr:hypothetical protein [Lentisphaeria bacterium]
MSNNRVKKITDFNEMKRPVKKKKHEVPVSQQTNSMDLFEVWFTAHWKLAATVLAAIVLVIVIGVIGWHISAAQKKAVQREIAAAASITELENVIAKYPENVNTAAAAMKLSSLYLAQKNYAKAYDALYKASQSTAADTFMRIRAAIDCAGILELQGNTPDAIKALDRIVSNIAVNEAQRAEAAYHSARLSLDKGDVKKAEIALAAINLSRASADSTDPYAIWALKAANLKKQIPAAPAKKAAVPAKKK